MGTFRCTYITDHQHLMDADEFCAQQANGCNVPEGIELTAEDKARLDGFAKAFHVAEDLVPYGKTFLRMDAYLKREYYEMLVQAIRNADADVE